VFVCVGGGVASGCASLEPSDEMRVTHSDDGRLAYVECVNSRHSWRLHCAGNVWTRVDPHDAAGISSCVDPTPPSDDDDNAGLVALYSTSGTSFPFRSASTPSQSLQF